MSSKQPLLILPPQSKTTIGNNRATSVGKATHLERVRNNQRRCRARQKDYITSLEDKIREYEGVEIERATGKKLEELAMENKLLKQLMQSLGLRDEFLEAYSNAVRLARNISWPPLDNEHCAQATERSCFSPVLEPLQPQLLQTIAREDHARHTPGPLPAASVPEEEPSDSTQVDLTLSWEPLDFPDASTSASELVGMDIHMEQFGQSTMDALMTKAFSNAVTAEDVSDTTTLCSWAFALVLKNNSKGYSAADLDIKLRVGYRNGATPTEACRVDNKVLLNVLAEIS